MAGGNEGKMSAGVPFDALVTNGGTVAISGASNGGGKPPSSPPASSPRRASRAEQEVARLTAGREE